MKSRSQWKTSNRLFNLRSRCTMASDGQGTHGKFSRFLEKYSFYGPGSSPY